MLISKVKDYIKENWIQKLCYETWLSPNVISAIVEPSRRIKFKANTLDILYDFFWLYKDHFYQDNMKKRYPKTQSMLWTFFRVKRVEKNLSLEQLAKAIKSSKLAVIRLELWESLPSFNSYTMQTIFDYLEFDEHEKKVIEKMVVAVKDIETLLRNYTKWKMI